MTMQFPENFRFGVASSAYQIEGATGEAGRGESIWDRFCREPGRVERGENGDVACDHYHRYVEDLDLMALLGLKLYRFSIAWPRLLPDGKGKPNQAGIDFYRRLSEGLLERDIAPLPTLYHWDLPQALQDEGGWLNRDTAARFAEYAVVAYEALGDLVDTWLTHNEPWVVAYEGYGWGSKAPGERNWRSAFIAAHHVLLSHGLAVRAFREERGWKGEIGIALNLMPAYPLNGTADDFAAAHLADGFHNRWFLDPVLRGGYPVDMVAEITHRFGPLDGIRPGDLETIAEPIDFLGVNYYSSDRVYADPDEPLLGVSAAKPSGETTSMGWEVTPRALYDLLLRLRRDYGEIPVVITENGAAFDDDPPVNGYVDDPRRLAYLRSHLEEVAHAIADGVDVRGYCAWSLLDNFEWERGYSKRFGIVYVDYETLRRIPKASALWYRELIAANSNSNGKGA
jgi:beta-glucosidase